METKQGDFIEIDYKGMLPDGEVFDTTDEKTAKEADIYGEKTLYKPIVICLGEGQVLKGLDKALLGKDSGKLTVDLKPADAFGSKNAKLIQLISTAKFKKQGVSPQPGMQVNIDGLFGLVKTVSGGRTMVDFNHPLAGKDLKYEVNIIRQVTEPADKIQGLVELSTSQDTKVTKTEKGYTVKTKKEISAELKKELTDKIKNLAKIEEKVEFAIGE